MGVSVSLEMSSLLVTSGASESESVVTEPTGSQFAAETNINLKNFGNKRHFATFSPSLRHLLRA